MRNTDQFGHGFFYQGSPGVRRTAHRDAGMTPAQISAQLDLLEVRAALETVRTLRRQVHDAHRELAQALHDAALLNTAPERTNR